jgi:choline transport protein
VKEPSVRIPRSMITTVVINSIIAYSFIFCLLFTIGDVATVSTSPTGYPIMEVYYEATKSKAGTNVMVAMLIIVIAISTFSMIASVSRLAWAFARDKGLPFSSFFSYVCPLP